MDEDYENTITMFNQYFKQIEKSYVDCLQLKTELIDKITSMKAKHTNINKNNNNNNKPIFAFCLDSFLYQYKIFALELEHINKLWIIHNNRMYSDYYKLYNIIIKFVKDDCVFNITDISLNKFPVYKELEQTREYDIDDITKIHDAILELIKNVCISINNKTYEINNYNTDRKVGFSISNYINTLNYEKLITISQNTLYINYMSFFHISQKKHLNALTQNIDHIIRDINENINIDHMFSMDDIVYEMNNSCDISMNAPPNTPTTNPTTPTTNPTTPTTNPTADPTNPTADPTNPTTDPTNPTTDPTNPIIKPDIIKPQSAVKHNIRQSNLLFT